MNSENEHILYDTQDGFIRDSWTTNVMLLNTYTKKSDYNLSFSLKNNNKTWIKTV